MNKQLLRKQFKDIRSTISLERRKEAEKALLDVLYPLFTNFEYILSFYSFPGEISMLALNSCLASEKRLCLPKIVNDSLESYLVEDPSRLETGTFQILEPSPKACAFISHEKLSLILVPGLAFDGTSHRLGYGKGYYDKFLSMLPGTPTYGIGFKEQGSLVNLPFFSHDIPMTKVFLF